MDKYLGESDKMVSAIFRVARKLAPTVVFIDEIDTVLRKRGGDANNSHVQSMQVDKEYPYIICICMTIFGVDTCARAFTAVNSLTPMLSCV